MVISVLLFIVRMLIDLLMLLDDVKYLVFWLVLMVYIFIIL